MKKKVLIVDDSPLIRSMLSELINQSPNFKVIGVAENPIEAREKIKTLEPDILTLDIEMPKMDGITFLRNLMRLRPMPVIMISTLTEMGAPATLEALELGAIDYITKPKQNVEKVLASYQQELLEKLETAAKARIIQRKKPVTNISQSSATASIKFRSNVLVAIGASTGGTEAIKDVVTHFPQHMPPVVVTQHIPPVFSTSYAKRLDSCCHMTVYEAEDGQKIEKGCIYIAPGDHHLHIMRKGSDLYCRLTQSPPVNRHRPAVDVMFDSIASHMGKNTITSVLTGMGADGAQGMLRLLNAGSKTIAQDEKSSVVWGMPKACIDLNAAQQILPLNKIADQIMDLAKLSD